MSQFPRVSTTYGAPMGRHGYGIAENCEPRSVRLFAVKLDSGGYDDGGAYWGRLAYERLYCAIADDNAMFQFVRALSRAHAALLLSLEPAQLKSPLQRLAWGRWSAHCGFFGKASPGYEIREFGQVHSHVDDWHDLCHFAQTLEKTS